ncbi:N-methyl-L-tryptophan oxidase [Sphaerisporangium sp. NPDC051011]|uniref:N-methyl-L-tryptophan oxidase n=1 Tax=Sphaerisporangium sp. NPDC051011 TaxID=3155792 RepID=UPI0033E0B6D1
MADARYDHIVIGAGALGAAAAYWLSMARRGSVLVCEQFTPGHSRGSSDDHSRIIRHAYHSPVYTALTPSAYDTWTEVEEHGGEKVVVRTGGLDLARVDTPGFEVLQSYRQSLDAADIPYDVLTAADVRDAWPQWVIDDDTTALFQRDGGLVDIRRATAQHLRLAREQGATVLDDCTVQDIESTSTGVLVRTGQGDFSAGSLVVCAGSWAPPLLERLGTSIPLALSQEQVQYFAADLEAFRPDRFPIWIWHGDHDFYGIPMYGEQGVKAARDMTGRFVTQETRSFEPDPAETEFVRGFLRERLPAWAGKTVLAKTCVYDLPRDREFIVGAVPGHPRVFLAVGAGHAGKFAGLLGRILADLAFENPPKYPIEAFSPDRSSLSEAAPARYRLGQEVS